MKTFFKICVSFLATAFAAVSCEIVNDIPYPVLEGAITAFEVDGMCDETGMAAGKASIDKTKHTVTVNVDDSVDPSKLIIRRFEASNSATIIPQGGVCLYPDLFPKTSFSNAEGDATAVNLTAPAHFILRTYQDYDWTVTVKQHVLREVSVDGQVGDAVIDLVSRNVIIYVSSDRDVSKLKVHKFSLGGQHGKVIPDPVEYDSFDFSEVPTTFFVRNGSAEYSFEWNVFVYKTQAQTTLTASHFARTVNATVKGTMPAGETLLLEYRTAGSSTWHVCPATDMETDGSKYTAIINGLTPSTKYFYRVTAGSQITAEADFTTTAALQLENSSFDDWNVDGKLYNPWASNASSFWDTGNRGATTVGESNSVSSDDTSTGHGKSALLQSKFIVIKFAAGNIFTGSYVKTDGTNGILDFGREFCAFPSKLTFDYKYKGAAINRVGSSDYEYLKGTSDEWQVYIALTDWDEPLQIRTNPKNQSLFDPEDPRVIAYGKAGGSADQTVWKAQTINLDYRYADRTPKYVVVVCTSSRYGDFFTGGDGSTLQIDNLNLIYE